MNYIFFETMGKEKKMDEGYGALPNSYSPQITNGISDPDPFSRDRLDSHCKAPAKRCSSDLISSQSRLESKSPKDLEYELTQCPTGADVPRL
jgi:hypothetical protein